MTRTSGRWRSLPGNFDTLHTRWLFASTNTFGIPDLLHTSIQDMPAWLVPYGQRVRANQPATEGCVHFFLDDYRFETVWSRPFKALTALKPYQSLLTPDFSLYCDWPWAIQLWNTYRNRWCGRFWQMLGWQVIPTISWGTAVSYEFCFLGVPRRTVVAVSAVGVNVDRPLAYQLFVDGFTEMVRRLQPVQVLSYGRLPDACHQLADIITYPTRWTNIRAARRSV